MMAAHRPPKNKFGTSGGGQVTKEDCPVSSSFLMCPPANKKAKLHHHPHGVAVVNKNHNNGEDDLKKKNDKNNNRLTSSSPIDVLAHPAATSTTAAANNGIHHEVVVKTLPPSLRGIAEAAKTFNSSSRSNIYSAAHERQQNPPPTAQLVAFPTEALYVLTCCVKTTSKKKVLLANAAASSSAHHDSVASTLVDSTADICSTGNSSSGSAGESQDCGGSGHNNGEKKPSNRCGVHPSNSSLECLVSRQKLTQQEAKLLPGAVATTPSVFVIDNKHAQHYCHFSQPKIFAIRPKQRIDLVQSSSSLLAESGGDTGVGSRLDQPNSCSANTSHSTSAPLKSPPTPSSTTVTVGEPMTIPPSPKKSNAMVALTSSPSLCFPLTPKLTSTTPSSVVATHAITPIPTSNNAAITHNDAKMPPSLPLSSHNDPSNNHSSNNDIGTSKIVAVNFSESYEAFSRLANMFWPGPMIIYAPARMISVGNAHEESSASSSLQQQQKPHNWQRSSSSSSNTSSSSSCPSLPSFTNLQSLEVGEGRNLSQVAVLPPSVLIPSRDLLLDLDGGSNDFFIGMQCPSHPLSRKILTEIYRPRGSSSTFSMKHSSSTDSLASYSSLDMSTLQHRQGNIRCGIAVVGSYIAPMTVGSASTSLVSTHDQKEESVLATTAANVKKILTSSPSPSSINSNLNRAAEQIYVVDGEDTTRENFSVPTCHYGGMSPVSLLVDGDNRTIYLLRHQGGVGKGGYNNLNEEKIYRALLQPPSSLKKSTSAVNVSGSNKAESNKEIDRVITAVLSRWKVVERNA
ncbi:hypothetical protein ACHAXM_003632 [Skeletonema potamos]